MSNIFFNVSAPAGSGKTFALIQHAIELAKQNQKVLIAQPTLALIDQTFQDILDRNSGVEVNRLATVAFQRRSNITAKVIAHMKDTDPAKGEILIISQNTLGRLPNAYRQFWNLFVDEVPGAFKVHAMNVAVTHGHLTQHITLADELLPNGVGVVVPNTTNGDRNALRLLVENKKRDTALDAFIPLALDILNEDKEVRVDAQAYIDLASGNASAKAVFFYAFQKTDFVTGYASVTMMGANFDATELYMIWELLYDVKWKPHPVITQKLRYQSHNNGDRLTIKYLIDGNWSQHFAGQSQPNGRTIFQDVCQAIQNELGQDFLWQANKSAQSSAFRVGQALPMVTHGINAMSYQTKHNVALVMAVNHSSGPASFLKKLGFTQEQLKITLQYQNEYQAMMRCSLRDPDATAPVTVCVVSKASADWLHMKFHNSKVEKLVSNVPEPKPIGQPAARKRSGAERTHDNREKNKVLAAAAKGEVYVPRPWKGK